MAAAASSKTIISMSTSPKPVFFSHSSLLPDSSHLLTPDNPYCLSVSLSSSSRLSSGFVILNPMAGAEHNNHYSSEKLPTVYVTYKECGVCDVHYSTASTGAGDCLRGMLLIIFYLLFFLVACVSAYEPTPTYQYLEINSEDSSYGKALAYMGTVTSSEEELAVYESLSVLVTNGSTFNFRPAQIAHDSFLGTHLTWIKAGDGLLFRLRPQQHSLFLGPYLQKVISVGDEIAPNEVCLPKSDGWSWGFLFNQSEKVEATLDIAAAIIGPLSASWKNRIVNVKDLYSSLVQVYREIFFPQREEEKFTVSYS